MRFDDPRSSLDSLIQTTLDRRSFLKNTSRLAGTSLVSTFAPGATGRDVAAPSFVEIERGKDEDLHVPLGYEANILLRWGDPVLQGAPRFNPRRQSAARQKLQFGYNNDFVAYLPLPPGSTDSAHGLLCINHEFTQARHMFPEHTTGRIEIEMAAHGLSIVEVMRQGGQWKVAATSAYARRIHTDTPIRLSGPAAGHPRLQTAHDPLGYEVAGTLGNCGGGTTPWGTVLSAEEHFQIYFLGRPGESGEEIVNHRRYGVVERPGFDWFSTNSRFHVGSHPHEPNRFGWVVEVDPYSPSSTPVKRTALGRFSHEAATTVHNPDGRVVVYSGDDQAMEYIYRYVSRGRYEPQKPESRHGLLDDGVLSVAKFDEEGLSWLPLQLGHGPLTAEHGFQSQADVLIETRRAADLLGATPMDRPEDIETNPATGTVFVMLSGGIERTPAQSGGPNPRPRNGAGHIVELSPPDGNHAASRFDWRVALLCGDPRRDQTAGRYSARTSENGWFTSPDNCAFDNEGRMWIATDAGSHGEFGNGSWVLDINAGTREVDSRHFLRCPRGAELCGPAFTPDGTTLFVAIQHPGQEPGASFESPTTRWPDFDPLLPPRPSIVAITRSDGGIIGS